ncbi:MAG: class I SAM-dependent methyltransferase [Kiritimatiellaeota bacterium]|nr:class I SAM-dependent methyltransferase [Kiritimatiellota bacterium]
MKATAIALENARLKASWDCFSAGHLAVYLAAGAEDQRINACSILTRALLIDTLWPRRFDALIEEELRFGVVMTWLFEQVRAGASRMALLDELHGGRRGARVPAVVRQAAAWLRTDACPLPDYVTDALLFRTADRPEEVLFEPALNTFAQRWSAQLAGLQAAPLTVLEIACGSGNEYLALRDFGLAAHLTYAGFDISWKNIENARCAHPGVNFFEASVLNSGLPDNACDVVFLHDLLGHLSPEALERALQEIMRIARKEAWLHCFNAADIPRHQIRPVGLYHRNRLSIAQLAASLSQTGAAVEAIPIPALLRRKFHFVQPYSASAVTFIARKTASASRRRQRRRNARSL